MHGKAVAAGLSGRYGIGVMTMSERAPAMDDATMKFGLLMESAQAHQKLAEGQLEKLRVHTQDLDGVVRDEIRRTLVEELQMLSAETARATRAFQKVRRGAAVRGAILSFSFALISALLPILIARWALPSAADVSALRTRRDEMSASLAELKQIGGQIDWRRCGDKRRLCVRVDRAAPVYGQKSDYFVVEGY
jgi:hypothetical protein